MGRSPCCSQVGLHRGPWTAKEDNLLTRYIEWHGEGDWRNLPEKAGLRRCGKSCRLRWLNYLRPTIKRGNISPYEEDLIIRLHRLLGNRWSLIAGRLPGRTDNEIKNYWNSHLSKKLRKRGIDPVTHKLLESDHKNMADNLTHEDSKGLQEGQVQMEQNQVNQESDHKYMADYYTHENSKASRLQEGQVQIEQNQVNQDRYISFPRGINSNSDYSEGAQDVHISKSMQAIIDDLNHILDEPMGLHTPSNQLDSLYSSMSFKSDQLPAANSCDLVMKVESPSPVGMELSEPQYQYHSLPLIDCYADDSNQCVQNYLQFCKRVDQNS